MGLHCCHLSVYERSRVAPEVVIRVGPNQLRESYENKPLYVSDTVYKILKCETLYHLTLTEAEGRGNYVTSQIPTTIAVRSTTKMSLSDRFTQYQKMRPQPSTVSDIRANMTSVKQASEANRQFVQQLANRPSVQAALGNLNKMSVKKRLIPRNVKARLNHNEVTGGGSQRGGLGRGSGQRGGLFRRGRDEESGLRGIPSSGGAKGGRFWSPGGDLRGNRGRGREGVSRGGRDAFGGDRRGRGANRGRGVERGRFQRGGRGGLRGQGRGRRAKLDVLKEELDSQLDEYMSNT